MALDTRSQNVGMTAKKVDLRALLRNASSTFLQSTISYHFGNPTSIRWTTLLLDSHYSEEALMRFQYNIVEKRTAADLVEAYEASLSSLKDRLNRKYVDIDLPIDNDEDEDNGGHW